MTPRRPRRRSYTLRVVDAQTVRAALEIAAPAAAGKRWAVLCPACVASSGALAGRRASGSCERCPYTGSCIVVQV